MCLIAHAPAKSRIKMDLMENAYDNNSDGWGIVYAHNGRLYVCKRMDNFATFKAVMNVVPDDVPLGIHFRYATHGAKDLTNVHPFQLLSITDGDPMDLCMMHNGVISSTSTWSKGTDDKRSDTSLYVDMILKPILKAHPEMAFNEAFIRLVGRDIGGGNKFLLLAGDGRHSIVNESSGHTDKESPDVWYSNAYTLKPSYRSNKSNSSNYYNPHGGQSYNDWWDRRNRNGATTTPTSQSNGSSSSAKSESSFVSQYEIETDIPEDLKTEIVKKYGFGAELVKNKQPNATGFGFGWVRNGSVLAFHSADFADKHRAWVKTRDDAKQQKAEPEVVKNLEVEKEKRLDSSDFKVMSLTEIFQWVADHPVACAEWLMKNCSFSGGQASVAKWVEANQEEASDFIFNKSHHNKIMDSKSAPVVSDPDEDAYRYMFAM